MNDMYRSIDRDHTNDAYSALWFCLTSSCHSPLPKPLQSTILLKRTRIFFRNPATVGDFLTVPHRLDSRHRNFQIFDWENMLCLLDHKDISVVRHAVKERQAHLLLFHLHEIFLSESPSQFTRSFWISSTTLRKRSPIHFRCPQWQVASILV